MLDAASITPESSSPDSQSFEDCLAWPEYPYRADPFVVMRKARHAPTEHDDFSWVGWFCDGSIDAIQLLHSEPRAGSTVGYGPKPETFYVLTEAEVWTLKRAFPNREVDTVRLAEVESLLLARGHEPNGRSASALFTLLANTVAEPAAATSDEFAHPKRTAGESPAEAEFVFRPDGDGYYLKGFGESGRISARDAIGLHDLFRLVQTPGVPVTMVELDAGPGVERLPGDTQSRQLVGDGQTFADIKSTRRQLLADIANADSDLERSELQGQLDRLEEAAKKMKGRNGKARDLNNPLDKLRPKLLKRIATARNAMRDNAKLPSLAEHFWLTVSSKAGCMVYRPAVEGLRWNVTKL